MHRVYRSRSIFQTQMSQVPAMSRQPGHPNLPNQRPIVPRRSSNTHQMDGMASIPGRRVYLPPPSQEVRIQQRGEGQRATRLSADAQGKKRAHEELDNFRSKADRYLDSSWPHHGTLNGRPEARSTLYLMRDSFNAVLASYQSRSKNQNMGTTAPDFQGTNLGSAGPSQQNSGHMPSGSSNKSRHATCRPVRAHGVA